MKHKNTITLITILLAATILTFKLYYHPPQQPPALVTSAANILKPTHTPTTTPPQPTLISFTILVNTTETIPVTVSINGDTALYYAPHTTFTLTGATVIHSGTTTTLPNVDAAMIIIGDLRAKCTTTNQTISLNEPFWPELFLQLMGYTTATLTGIAPCKNLYLVTAA